MRKDSITMEKLGLNTIREEFLSYFEGKGHFRRASFSLIPENDKSLLLIGAGMAPLKPYFAGLETPPAKRMTTCQKCIRTGDIDNVGHTDRHGTFFEMLGNFSFGDYFKEDAIRWSWDFSTNVLKLPKEKLWVTIYDGDEEARSLWRDMIGIPADHYMKLLVGFGYSEIPYVRGVQKNRRKVHRWTEESRGQLELL